MSDQGGSNCCKLKIFVSNIFCCVLPDSWLPSLFLLLKTLKKLNLKDISKKFYTKLKPIICTNFLFNFRVSLNKYSLKSSQPNLFLKYVVCVFCITKYHCAGACQGVHGILGSGHAE